MSPAADPPLSSATLGGAWKVARRETAGLNPAQGSTLVYLNDLGVAVEDFPQVARGLHPMFLHCLEQAEDVPHARQRDALLAGQVLDDLDLADVPLRVTTPVRGGAVRLDEAGILIEHERAGVGLQDLRRHADRVQRLVEIAERRLGATGASSTAHGVRHGPPILVRVTRLSTPLSARPHRLSKARRGQMSPPRTHPSPRPRWVALGRCTPGRRPE